MLERLAEVSNEVDADMDWFQVREGCGGESVGLCERDEVEDAISSDNDVDIVFDAEAAGGEFDGDKVSG